MKYFLYASCALALLSVPAQAHVTANPDNGQAGNYFQTSFRVSHGCDGKDTTAVHIKIPAGFVVLKPQHKPGWTVEIKKNKLDKPVSAGHGKMADEEFSEVIWTGGVLPDQEYDEFGLLVKLPEKAQTLWFPVTQDCGVEKVEWTQIPAAGQEWHELEKPAPFVKVEGALDHSMDHSLDHSLDHSMPAHSHSH